MLYISCNDSGGGVNSYFGERDVTKIQGLYQRRMKEKKWIDVVCCFVLLNNYWGILTVPGFHHEPCPLLDSMITYGARILIRDFVCGITTLITCLESWERIRVVRSNWVTVVLGFWVESRVFIADWQWVSQGQGGYFIHPGNPWETPPLLTPINQLHQSPPLPISPRKRSQSPVSLLYCHTAFFCFWWFAATQLARQLQQERTQVVCSSKEAWKRPARRHSRFLIFFVY